jgi:hypothetical protein
VALLFYTEVSSPPTGIRILAHGDKCYRSNHVNKDGEHTYHVITKSSKHNYARKLYSTAKVSLSLIVCPSALVYQLKNHVPLTYELYLALKANQARRQPPTTFEIDLASGRRNASDVTVVAYFQKLAADQEALAQARKVCSLFFPMSNSSHTPYRNASTTTSGSGCWWTGLSLPTSPSQWSRTLGSTIFFSTHTMDKIRFAYRLQPRLNDGSSIVQMMR